MNYWVGSREIQSSYAVQLSNIVEARHSKCWHLLKNVDFNETTLWHNFIIVLWDFFKLFFKKKLLNLETEFLI